MEGQQLAALMTSLVTIEQKLEALESRLVSNEDKIAEEHTPLAAQKPRYLLNRAHRFTDNRCVFERFGDALNHVLSFLPPASLGGLDTAMTNREGREAFWLPAVQRLNVAAVVLAEMKESSTLMSALQWLIARGIAMPELLKLSFDTELGGHLNDTAGEMLACLRGCSAASMSCIHRVDLSNCPRFSAAGLTHLERCVNLTHLDLSMRPDRATLKDGDWQQLSDAKWKCFKTLTTVNVKATGLTAGIGADILVTRCPGLIEIRGITGNDNTLEQLGVLKDLEVIELSLTGTYTPLGLANLKKLPKLRVLDLTSCSHINAVMNALSSSTSIRELCFTTSPRLTAADCDVLASVAFAHLTRLKVELSSGLTTQNLAHIGSLVELQELDLSNSRLSVPNSGLSMLYSLRGLTQLRVLNLAKAAVADADLDGLCGLVSLEHIDISGSTVVTEAAVTRLVNAYQGLKTVLLVGCHRISKNFIQSLAVRLKVRE